MGSADATDSKVSLMAFQIDSFKNQFTEVAILPPYCSFGELALISNKPRAATIRAKSDCHFAVLGKDDYQKILGSMQLKRLYQKVDFLKTIPMFSKWHKEALIKLSYFFKEKKFKRNYSVFKEGQPAMN